MELLLPLSMPQLRPCISVTGVIAFGEAAVNKWLASSAFCEQMCSVLML
jgi:hypothetical protein